MASAGPYASRYLASRQITTPAPHRSVYYRPDALPAAQPTASKHWRHRNSWQKSVVCCRKLWCTNWLLSADSISHFCQLWVSIFIGISWFLFTNDLLLYLKTVKFAYGTWWNNETYWNCSEIAILWDHGDTFDRNREVRWQVEKKVAILYTCRQKWAEKPLCVSLKNRTSFVIR